MRIGFIGTGVMGTGIINNLLRAGEQVTVFNRTPAHAKAVLANGASWAASPQLWSLKSMWFSPWWAFPRMSKLCTWGQLVY